MASDLSAAVMQAIVNLTHINAPDTLSTATDPLNLSPIVNFTSGAGANQANKAYHEILTIASGGTGTIDLVGTSETNIYGEDLDFVRIKGLYVRNTSDDNIVEVGGGAAPWINWVKAAGDAVVVRPGGFLLLVAPDATGYPVTATTADILTVTDDGSASGSATVDVVLIGSNS